MSLVTPTDPARGTSREPAPSVAVLRQNANSAAIVRDWPKSVRSCGHTQREHRWTDDDGAKFGSSGNCTVRVIPCHSGPLAGNLQQVMDAFAALGANYEGLPQFGIVALSIPRQADIPAVKRLLRQGERDGWWVYDEGCIGDDWDAA